MKRTHKEVSATSEPPEAEKKARGEPKEPPAEGGNGSSLTPLLDKDLLGLILYATGDAITVLRCRLVCSLLRDLIDEETFWRQFLCHSLSPRTVSTNSKVFGSSVPPFFVWDTGERAAVWPPEEGRDPEQPPTVPPGIPESRERCRDIAIVRAVQDRWAAMYECVSADEASEGSDEDEGEEERYFPTWGGPFYMMEPENGVNPMVSLHIEMDIHSDGPGVRNLAELKSLPANTLEGKTMWQFTYYSVKIAPTDLANDSVPNAQNQQPKSQGTVRAWERMCKATMARMKGFFVEYRTVIARGQGGSEFWTYGVTKSRCYCGVVSHDYD